nr:P-II family nitrogen regulator [Methylonatrum kenyense]
MVFVDEDKAESVIDAARQAGASGATIIGNAQGQGLKRRFGLFGLEVLGLRTVLLFLVEARRAGAVMDAIAEAAGLDETAETGVALELDVSRATGLKEHIAMLAREHPL